MFLANAQSIHTVRWVNKLSDFGHEVTLVTTRDNLPDDLLSPAISSKVNIEALPFEAGRGQGYFTNARACSRLFQKLGPDVVNAHYASGYGTLARMAKLQPLALSVWGSDVFSFPEKSILHRRLVISNLKYADLVLSTSAVMASRVRQLLREPEMRIPVTPFGVDLDRFPVKTDFSSREHSKSVGVIKSLKPHYGIQHLLEACWILKTDDKYSGAALNFHLNIYGDGVYREALRHLTTTLQISDAVTFHGAIPNSQVPLVLQGFDIFAMPSLEESFGVSVVEAMAAGLPVLTSDAQGLKEVVTHGVDGLQFRAGDSYELAAGLARLLASRDERQRLGAEARRTVERRYSFDVNVSSLLSELEELVSRQ